jgi:phospholipase C
LNIEIFSKNNFFPMTKIMTTTIATLLIVSLFLGSTSYALKSENDKLGTTTPIKHLVVIFQENVSYDHYFGTYPKAANLSGEPQFVASKYTPHANGLTDKLLTHNPNSANPFRLANTFATGTDGASRAKQMILCDQNHDYTPEQQAYDGGLLDQFVQKVGVGQINADGTITCPSNANPTSNNLTMSYYDGNTVTALWNYAQHYAMSDNSFSTTFGPSTPGMLNLVSGQTGGANPSSIPDAVANGAVIGDPDGAFDDCSGSTKVSMSGKNIGDLLNDKGISWGFFEGGFKPTTPWNPVTNSPAKCQQNTLSIVDGHTLNDYSAHHEPFQYYQSTSNPHHLPPTSVAMIGKQGDQANHNYDLVDFWAAVNAGNMPAVSFLKAPRVQDGHAGYSDPIDEQAFIVNATNALMKTPEWKSTAIIILYDDSDGFYDHVMPKIVNNSNDPEYDFVKTCGGKKVAGDQNDRCGYGPRQPLLVISPFAKANFVSHEISDQTSVLKFIEDNWKTGKIPDPTSFDKRAHSLNNMFDFDEGDNSKLLLDYKTGTILP